MAEGTIGIGTRLPEHLSLSHDIETLRTGLPAIS
jgi:hypothetical protein